MKTRVELLFVILLCLFAPLAASAQGSAGLPQLILTPLTGGLVDPVHITNAGDGSGRIFVVEQDGRIRIVRNGVLAPAPFLDITGRVFSGGERGLLSVAFPPGFGGKGYFYVNYTRNLNLDGATVVSRFFVTANPDAADPASEQVLLVIPQPFANHNGGQLAFGPDGFLYIGTGDGGSGGDPSNNAQNPGALLGKMLRIDVEAGTVPYAIPLVNPFRNNPGFRPEIWALGMRNPFRFSFDRLTGDLYIADVGQNRLEEVDFQPAASTGGENYGWNIMEGSECFNAANFLIPLPQCNRAGLTLPVAEYGRDQGCSVTGGFVYRGPNFPRMFGMYFYSDFCSGTIWGLKRQDGLWQNNPLFSTGFGVTTFGEDERGTIYLSDYSGGRILSVADTFGVMPVPTGRETFSHPPSFGPQIELHPSTAKPIGVGSVVLGEGFLGLRVGLPPFGGPVDIYFGVSAPSIDPRLFVLKSDNTFQPVSAGLVPWKSSVALPVNEALFGNIPAASLPSGTYDLYLAVTPAGSTGAFYLWTTFFSVP